MDLNRYDQTTVAMWGRAYAAVIARYGVHPLVDAAVAAVLCRLRRCDTAPSLLAAYEAGSTEDHVLVASILPDAPGELVLDQVRDAAFHIRWLQLQGINA